MGRTGIRFVALIIVFLSVAACKHALKPVKDPAVPDEGPSYTILPPAGDGWYSVQGKSTGRFERVFGKQSGSGTHTYTATAAEIHTAIEFSEPEMLLDFVQKSLQMDFDYRRFKLLSEEAVLDEKFGPYSVRFYQEAEDHGAPAGDAAGPLVMKLFGYVFIHPNAENLLLSVSYSERGRPDELDSNFKEAARTFIEGLRLK